MADDDGTILSLDEEPLLGRLDDLGVGQLRTAEAGGPPPDGWADVERRSRAHARRRRLPLLIAVAAVVVLLAGLLAVARRDDSRAVVTGPSTELPYLLPPEDAIGVQASVGSRPHLQTGEEVVYGYHFLFFLPGSSEQISMSLGDLGVDIGTEPAASTSTTESSEPQVIDLGGGRTAVWPRLPHPETWPTQPVEAPPLTGASLECEPLQVGSDGMPVPEVPIEQWASFGAPSLEGRFGRFTVQLSDSGEIHETCRFEGAALQLNDLASKLRPVDAATWQAYLERYLIEERPSGAPGEPEIPGRTEAETEIKDAFERVTERDPNGRYVNLVDGADIARMDAMLAEIRTALGGLPPAVLEVDEVHFVNAELAQVDARATVELPTGPVTFEAISGTVVLVDGRWLVTTSTLEGFAARAKLIDVDPPPGG